MKIKAVLLLLAAALLPALGHAQSQRCVTAGNATVLRGTTPVCGTVLLRNTFPVFVANPAAINLSGITNGVWHSFASGCPAGATGMAVLLVGSAAAGSIAREFRETGSSDNYVSDVTPPSEQVVRFVGLNAGSFDYYSANDASSDLIYPLVCFGPEATFLSAIVPMGSTLTTSYVNTYSTGGHAPGGHAAVFSIHGGTDYDVYFRHPSSTDTFDNGNESLGRRDFFTALNGSQQYSAKAGNAGRQPYLVAYFTAQVTEANPSTHNGVTRTPGTAGSYQNLSTSGDTTPMGHIYYLHSPTTGYAFQLSGQGSTWTAPNLNPAGGYTGLGIAISPAQANIANTALVISELAYF